MSDANKFLASFQKRQEGKGVEVPFLFVPSTPSPDPQEPPHPAPKVDRYPTARPAADATPPAHVRLDEQRLVATLTSCLNDAPCRDTARRIFRVLFTVALNVNRALGRSDAASVAVFHLPAELVYSHLGLGKSAFYDNLKYLTGAGLVACEAHLGRLEGFQRNVATGTLWAVSLAPERVLSGQRAPVRLGHDDWQRDWRDLNRDRTEGRTVAALLDIPPKKKKGDQAAKSSSSDDVAGQSIQRKRLQCGLKTLKEWSLTPLLSKNPDTETVRPDFGQGLEVVWALGDAANEPKAGRAAMIDAQARSLAAAFGDGDKSLNFWRKLLWNLTRGIKRGHDLTDDVAFVLARVLRDVQQDNQNGGSKVRRVAAVVNAALSKSGLLDLLRSFEGDHVGVRPAVKVAA